MRTLSISAAIVALAATASAHGGVGKYIIENTEYLGWQPYNPSTGQSTIQRQYSSYDPILNPSGTNIRCNNQGQTSQLHAPIKAGNKITAIWTQWTHAEGPVTVYMAKCPGSCANFDGSGNVWFKIDQAGLLSGTVNKGKWGNGVVLDTLQWTSTIPASLAPGNYLIMIRHEVLAIHQANTPQFYPECAQLTVSGSGSASPSGSFLCPLPGCFSMSDPGVTIDIYSSTAMTYTVPGPAVWPAGSGSGTSPPPASTTAAPPPVASSTIAVPPPASTSSPATGGSVQKYGQCGGIGYTGATTCVSSTCTKVNDYYYQCL